MSLHGYKVGDKVVASNHLGGWTSHTYGVIIRLTPTTVRVQVYKSSVKEKYSDPSQSSSKTTCNFDEPISMNEVYRWSRSGGYMGKKDASGGFSILHHFNPDNVESNETYY